MAPLVGRALHAEADGDEEDEDADDGGVEHGVDGGRGGFGERTREMIGKEAKREDRKVECWVLLLLYSVSLFVFTLRKKGKG
jgi:hypothetical protein